VVAVLADEDVVAHHLEVLAGLEATVGDREERDQRRLRRISGADADALAAQIGDRLHRPVGAHEHDAREIAIGIAHRDRLRAIRRSAMRMDPGERRVPCDVDLAGEVRGDLALVVVKQDEIEGQAVGVEVSLEAIPDRDNLGIVRDGSEDERLHDQNSGRPHTALPMKS
jgi:hypothetical protein